MTTQELIRQAAVQAPEKDLEELVRRIVEVADPEKIILFGSAATGRMGAHSDLDVLVIKGGSYDHHALTVDIYAALSDIEYPKDILVVTPEQVERYKDSFCLVLYPALREGKAIYDASKV